jgi:hypothetical protein
MKRIALCFLGLALLLVAPVVTEPQNRQANTTDLGVELEAYSHRLRRPQVLIRGRWQLRVHLFVVILPSLSISPTLSFEPLRFWSRTTGPQILLRYPSLSSCSTQKIYRLRISFSHFTRMEKLTQPGSES